ncbi:MAG: paraquat-inducible protein A [Endozoicomonas sp. (ex Botrylloides leachii)]|nr:paraquat-inducible protein A [Endozoicomonas sp. (ex Botrylloides leachii)]
MSSDITISTSRIWLCQRCDLVVTAVDLSGRDKASCPRCGHVISRSKPDALGTLLALIITGLVLYIPANFYPVLSMELLGFHNSSSLWSSVVSIWEQGFYPVAILVFLLAMFIPLLRLLSLLVLFLAVLFAKRGLLARAIMRTYCHLGEWGMVDIYLLGILISVVKLADMATVHMGVGLFCFACFTVIEITLSLNVNKAAIWEHIGLE